MWHNTAVVFLENQIFKSIPGNLHGPIKKPNHDIKNNLGKVIFFCSITKNPEYYVHLSAVVETGSRFHTPSKMIFQLNVSIFYCYSDLFLRYSKYFSLALKCISLIWCVPKLKFLLSVFLYPIFR